MDIISQISMQFVDPLFEFFGTDKETVTGLALFAWLLTQACKRYWGVRGVYVKYIAAGWSTFFATVQTLRNVDRSHPTDNDIINWFGMIILVSLITIGSAKLPKKVTDNRPPIAEGEGEEEEYEPVEEAPIVKPQPTRTRAKAKPKPAIEPEATPQQIAAGRALLLSADPDTMKGVAALYKQAQTKGNTNEQV